MNIDIELRFKESRFFRLIDNFFIDPTKKRIEFKEKHFTFESVETLKKAVYHILECFETCKNENECFDKMKKEFQIILF